MLGEEEMVKAVLGILFGPRCHRVVDVSRLLPDLFDRHRRHVRVGQHRDDERDDGARQDRHEVPGQHAHLGA